MIKAKHIPQAVGRRLLESGIIEAFTPFEYLVPTTAAQLPPDTAQEDHDRQRNGFIELVNALMPIDQISRFVHAGLDESDYPFLTVRDMKPKFSVALRQGATRPRPTPDIPSFDLAANRSEQKKAGYFDVDELKYTMSLAYYRPAIALSILYFRKFMVGYTFFLLEEVKPQLSGDLEETITFFCQSWHQDAFMKILYPVVALHMHPHVSLDEVRVEEPGFTQGILKKSVAWIHNNSLFHAMTNMEKHGFEAKLTCGAAGFMTASISREGLLYSIYERIIADRDNSQIRLDLDRVSVEGRVWKPAKLASGPTTEKRPTQASPSPKTG